MASRNPEETEGIDFELDTPIDGNTLTDTEKKPHFDDAEPAIPPNDKQVDRPPDGGYGWVYVGCVFLINAHTWGVNSVSD